MLALLRSILSAAFIAAFIGAAVLLWITMDERQKDPRRHHQSFSNAHGGKFQIYDLLLDIPPDQAVTSAWNTESDIIEFRGRHRLYPGANFASGLTIYGMEAWKFSGTHRSAAKWEIGDIQISFGLSDATQACNTPRKEWPLVDRNEIYRDGEAGARDILAFPNVNFFGGKLILHRRKRWLCSSGDYHYEAYAPLSPMVRLELRVGDCDLHGRPLVDVVRDVERSVRSWIVEPKVLPLEDPAFCEKSRR